VTFRLRWHATIFDSKTGHLRVFCLPHVPVRIPMLFLALAIVLALVPPLLCLGLRLLVGARLLLVSAPCASPPSAIYRDHTRREFGPLRLSLMQALVTGTWLVQLPLLLDRVRYLPDFDEHRVRLFRWFRWDATSGVCGNCRIVWVELASLHRYLGRRLLLCPSCSNRCLVLWPFGW
jgi:hypothetical protein